MALNDEHKKQITGLFKENIKGAFFEDMEFENLEQALAAKQHLLDLINNFDVSDCVVCDEFDEE